MAVTDIEGRISKLEIKVSNMAEDLEQLQKENDDMGLWLSEMFAKMPGMYVLDPIDYRAIYNPKEYTIDNIPLGKMPIVKTWFDGDIPNVGAIVSAKVIRKLHNIPVSMLQAPLNFDTVLIDISRLVSTPSTVVAENVSPYITKYTHTVTYEGDDTIVERSYSFLVVTEPSWYEYNEMVATGAERGLNYFDQAGIYYIDDKSVNRMFLYADTTLLHDRIVFDSPITIPAQSAPTVSITSPNGSSGALTFDDEGDLNINNDKIVTQTSMENYVNESILGGTW